MVLENAVQNVYQRQYAYKAQGLLPPSEAPAGLGLGCGLRLCGPVCLALQVRLFPLL